MSKKKNRARNVNFKVAPKQDAQPSTGPILEPSNQTQFQDQVIDSDRPSIIDFWAEWCAPCKATAPAFAAAADRFGDQVNFVKINTEQNRAVAQAFHIRSIPTMVMMYRGEVVDTHIGARGQDAIEGMARKLIKKAEKAEKAEQKASGETGAEEGGLWSKIKGVFHRETGADQAA